MLLNAVPNPAGKFVKSDPSPTKLVAVIIPVEPNLILMIKFITLYHQNLYFV